jgi:predicted RNA-binding Zn ribbon-like protein
VVYHQVVIARFSFHRGSPALDFVGTVGRRASQAEERLPDPAALDAWLREAGLVDGRTHPTAADLRAARALRESIAAVFAALAARAAPPRADVAAINEAARASALATPSLHGPALRVRWTTDHPVDAALGRIAADAIDVAATRRDRLVRCELDGCGALLLSASRGAPRRWCSMETCGNVAKVAAHRARLRAAAANDGATAGAAPRAPRRTIAR